MSEPETANIAAENSNETHMPQRVNNEGNSLSHHMKRMSLTTAVSTALPPSSPVGPLDSSHQNASPSASSRSAKPPIRRAPSSSSLGGNEKPTTPALHKRSSVSSLKEGEGKTPPRSPTLRRSSSYFHNLSMGDRSSLPPPLEEAPKRPVTAASVAHDFFEKELEVKHGSSEVAKSAQTVVILQDACYGHRYSRPKTSKSALSTIVERPERVHASLLGVATAYVRLGGRHAEGPAAPHPLRDPLSLPPAPFKIHKTPRTLSLRSPAAAAVHGKEWMEELSVMCERAESKLAINGKELARENVNGQSSADPVAEKPRLHEGDLYLCSGSLGALEGALGGVCEAVDAVFSEKGPRRAFVCIRPPGHHCAADMPSGFCWINNVHVGIGYAAITHGLTHAAIIDFDLHHGDGSQSITWDHNTRVASLPKNTPMSRKIPIGYFSLHDINSYPCEMGDEEKVRNASLCIENAHGQSIWNVHLQPWKTASDFWALYEDRYLVLLAKARTFLKAHNEKLRQTPTHPKPKAAIFLSAGFDASEWESPGMQRHQVHVPTEFYARFTRDVVKMAEEESLGVDGRVISVLEGGYSDRALMSGTLSHISGLTTKTSTSRPSTSGSSVFGQEVHDRIGSMDLNGGSPRSSNSTSKQGAQDYDPTWWSVPNLEELETLIDPMAHVAPAPKGPRGKVQPTFTMPTESFISKVVEAPQGRRSTSGAARPPPAIIPRGPTPPPPEVGWATASLELRNLLVPSNRETKSCKPEDLNAEATRKRRDRQSNIGLVGLPAEEPPIDAKPMQLREKRSKVPDIREEDPKAASRASRRKTIAEPNLLAKEATPPPVPLVTRPARRRSSAASSVVSVGTTNVDRGLDPSLPSISDQQEQINFKKARPPVVSHADSVKPKIAARRPNVARKPSSNSTNVTGQSERFHTAETLSTNEEVKSKDIDQLASNMRGMSIKLDVPPKDEYEAREPKAKPASRGRPLKTMAAKTAKAKSPTKPKAKTSAGVLHPVPMAYKQTGGILPSPLSNSTPSTRDTQEPPPMDDLPNQNSAQSTINAEAVPRPPMRPPPSVSEPTVPSPNTPKPPPATPNPTMPPLPAEPPQFSPITPAQPATPITAKRNTKENLPVFTATSPISFGKPKQPAIDEAVMQSVGGSINPRPMSSDLSICRSTTPVATSENQSSSRPSQPPLTQPASMEGREEASGGMKREEGQSSIWDIPDTPRVRHA